MPCSAQPNPVYFGMGDGSGSHSTLHLPKHSEGFQATPACLCCAACMFMVGHNGEDG